MSAPPARRPSVEDREREIFAFVRSRGEDGATIREIFEETTRRLEDRVTVQAYHKVVNRLVAADKLQVVEDAAADGGRRHIVAPYLHAENALTLDDVYAVLEELEPSDAIARVIDAREYFEERRADTLARAARELLQEDPRELVERFLLERAEEVRADLEMLEERELRDRELEGRVDGELRELKQHAYRHLGLSDAALNLPKELGTGHPLTVDRDQLRRELALRVFGERAIELVDVNPVADPQEWNRTPIAGSDASTHGSVLQIATAQSFTDDVGSQVVTFNNSVVEVQPGGSVSPGRGEALFYSIPATRQAIDDRSNRGMVLAPFMYRYLSESQYEHMAKAATDVVQWRADAAVFLGNARSPTGDLIPRPRVHLRDGTITPQEREYNHYRLLNEYGDMVREGIAHSRTILDRVMTARGASIFGGAVKTTQTRFFSSLINWYIARGSRQRLGAPIDPGWDMTRAAHIADNEAMSLLLSTLTPQLGATRAERAGRYYVTFQIMRPFHSLTEYFRAHTDDPREWVDRFRTRQQSEQAEYDDGQSPELPYLARVHDVADEDFVYMCVNGDYVSFYVGHTGADPPPIAPRYEFLESLRVAGDAEAAARRVRENVRLIVAAIDRNGLALDREHNYLSRKTLVKIIPRVLFDAHEKCKALGRQLESELRSIVIANLLGMRNARDLQPDEVKFLPLSVRRFVERYQRAQEAERRNDQPYER